jgi:urocanate hydratase
MYSGPQGIVHGTTITVMNAARMCLRKRGIPPGKDDFRGMLFVTAGLGGMGGAQPLAITMNEGVALVAEVEEWRIRKRLETRYLDVMSRDVDEAIDMALAAKDQLGLFDVEGVAI